MIIVLFVSATRSDHCLCFLIEIGELVERFEAFHSRRRDSHSARLVSVSYHRANTFIARLSFSN